MNASDIISTAETTLLDPSHQYWTSPELLSYINDAQRQIVNFKPEANSKVENVPLDAGVRQQLPALASQLIDVTRNKAGNAITAVDQRDLDRMVPDWPTMPEAGAIEHYMYDDRSPDTFDVYPPAQASTEVEVIYSATLNDLNSTGDTLDLGEQYRAAVIEYVLYRAHTKDTTAAEPQRAMAHYQQFKQMLGVGSQAENSVAAGHLDANPPHELR